VALQGGHSPVKPGKVSEFDIGQEKVRACLWFAVAVAISQNKHNPSTVK